MNPAVSIAMAVTMNISPLRAILYVIVQCGGAILGSLILKRFVSMQYTGIVKAVKI